MIEIIDGFSVFKKQAVDDRSVKANNTDRNNIFWKYDGMLVVTTDADKLWMYLESTDSWKEIGAVTSVNGQTGDVIIDAGSTISGTTNYLSKYNSSGNNIINSRAFDDGTNFVVGYDNTPLSTFTFKQNLNEFKGMYVFNDNIGSSAAAVIIVGGWANKTGNQKAGVELGYLPEATSAWAGYGVAKDSFVRVGSQGGNLNIIQATTVSGKGDVGFYRTAASTVPTLFIKNDGFVGIETNTPGARFDISGRLKFDTDTTSPDRAKIKIGDGTGWKTHFSLDNGSNLITIQDNGKMGFNDTSPTRAISIKNQESTTTIGNNSFIAIKLNNEYAATFNTGSEIQFYMQQYPLTVIRGIYSRNSNSKYSGDILFGTNDVSNNTMTERMRLTAEGRFGIGTTTIPARLTLGVDSSSTILTGTSAHGGIHFVQTGSDDEYVGITTSAFASDKNTTQGGILIQASGNYGTKIHFLTTDSFASGQKLRATLDHTGNFLINTTDAYAKLTVNGNIALPYGNIIRVFDATYPTILETGWDGSEDFLKLYTPGTRSGAARIAIRSNGEITANGILFVYGSGLDGSTFQKTAIYSDTTKGFLVEAPKNSGGTKLDINFAWRGDSTPSLKIAGSNGQVNVNNLAGSGTRMVVADPSGWLSTQAIPSSPAAMQFTYLDLADNSPTTVLSAGVNYIIRGGKSCRIDLPQFPTEGQTIILRTKSYSGYNSSTQPYLRAYGGFAKIYRKSGTSSSYIPLNYQGGTLIYNSTSTYWHLEGESELPPVVDLQGDRAFMCYEYPTFEMKWVPEPDVKTFSDNYTVYKFSQLPSGPTVILSSLSSDKFHQADWQHSVTNEGAVNKTLLIKSGFFVSNNSGGADYRMALIARESSIPYISGYSTYYIPSDAKVVAVTNHWIDYGGDNEVIKLGSEAGSNATTTVGGFIWIEYEMLIEPGQTLYFRSVIAEESGTGALVDVTRVVYNTKMY